MEVTNNPPAPTPTPEPGDGGSGGNDPCARSTDSGQAITGQNRGFLHAILSFFGLGKDRHVQAQQCVEPPNIAVIASVDIASTDGTPYVVGQTLTGQFTVKNNGDVAVTMQPLVLGGRLNGDDACGNYPGACPDFNPVNITINPKATYTYYQIFVPQLPGTYSFQVFFETGGDWYWNLGTENGANNNVEVEVYPSFKLPLPGGKNWLLTVEAGGKAYDGVDDPFHYPDAAYFSLDFSSRTLESNGERQNNVKIMAAAAGKVAEVGTDINHPNGYYVVVNHNYDINPSIGYTTWYAHLKNPPLVSRGQDVVQGQQLGIMGNTGQSEGIHLHLGFKYNENRDSNTEELRNVKMEGLKIEEFKVGGPNSSDWRYYLSTNTP